MIIVVFSIPLQNSIQQPEWRNGRRDGLKIHCPSKMCGFESRLGHENDRHRRYFRAAAMKCQRYPFPPPLYLSFSRPRALFFIEGRSPRTPPQSAKGLRSDRHRRYFRAAAMKCRRYPFPPPLYLSFSRPRASFFIGGSIIAVLRSFLLLMQDYNVAYGAKRALKRMKRTRKRLKGVGRMLQKVAEKFGL